MKVLLINATENIDYLDSLIGATIVLFILSLITEKFVELIRKYIAVPPKYNKLNWYRNINAKTTFGVNQDNEELKYKKKKEISILAVVIGILIAVFAKASLFDLLSGNPQDKLFWPEQAEGVESNWLSIKFILGILLTGFFLSFGSKFFHDLLDILYQTKEYKRKLLNKETYKQNSAADVVTIIEADSFSLAKQALAQHGKDIKEKYPDLIVSLEIGNTVNNQIGIIANIKSKPPEDFPKYVLTDLENGTKTKVEIETIIDSIAEAHYGLECRVRNRKKINETGALGGVLLSNHTGDSKFFLTCSHVALSGSSDNRGGFNMEDGFKEDIQILGKKGRASGSLIYAKLDENNDSAIIKLDDNKNFDWNNALPDGSKLGDAISVIDLKDNSDVAFYSSKKRRVIKGKIHKKRSKSEVKIKYRDQEVKSFFDLIVVGDNFGGSWSAISAKGDSGSILFDSKQRPFGLIIGGGNILNTEGNSFTYAIPIQHILKETNTKIYQS